KDITKEKHLEEEHKQAKEKLQKSEIKYKTLYDSSMDAIMILSMEKGFISANSASLKMFEYKDDKEFISKNPWDLSPEYQPDGVLSSIKAQEVMKIAMEKGSHSFDWKHKRINGKEFFASVLLNRMELQGKEILQATVRDITGRKRAEDRIKHLNGVLNAIRNVNQLILVEKDKDRLLQKSCDALIDARDYDLAWLGLLRDDNKFASVISSGMGKDIKHFKEKIMSGDHPPCVKRALIRKNHLIVVDKSKECENCFVKNTCEGKETAIIHVEHGGSLFGLLTVSLRSGVSIDDEEKELLKEVAGDIAFALYNMDLEKARWQAEVALRQSEERLRIKLEYILSPDEDVKDVFLTDLVDLKDLQQIQDAFAAANDVASIISDVDGKPITKPSNFCGVCEIIRSTKKGNKNCIKSDKILGKKAKAFMKPIYEECHSCGFIDASAPIIVGGKHIANWLIGQSNIMGVDKHRIETYAKEIDADKNKMLSAFKKMPEMSLAKFEERLDLLWIMAKEISTLGYSNIILAKDITELKKAEDKLQKAHEELEIRVKERTTDLQTANKELEAFSYSVSHDLRAPLRAIDGFSQILLEDYIDILDEEGQRYLQRVRAGTQNMGQLIDDILHLSRIGRQPMVKEAIKLENIVKETYKLLKNEWKDRKVNFSVHQCQAAQADPRLMQIVFTNLLSNALKFTRNKKAAKIKFGCNTEDGQNVFYVKDNGAGFDMKYVDKLFSPFQRLHSSEEYEGTGIGTAIVKRIMDRHSGKIWVESKVGKGTVFYFTLNE
ncbi:MAG: PocR ligand-binding domain-containing protein, partial [Calditrichales bacterium]|nr:PocR ligand-binding domain-containing protein [Calditrichales bacterium]